jgi:hypothetical protein
MAHATQFTARRLAVRVAIFVAGLVTYIVDADAIYMTTDIGATQLIN